MAGSRNVSPAEMWLLTRIAGPGLRDVVRALIQGRKSSRTTRRERHPFEDPVEQRRPPLVGLHPMCPSGGRPRMNASSRFARLGADVPRATMRGDVIARSPWAAMPPSRLAGAETIRWLSGSRSQAPTRTGRRPARRPCSRMPSRTRAALGRTACCSCHGFTGSPQSMRPWARHLEAAGSRSCCPGCPATARAGRS